MEQAVKKSIAKFLKRYTFISCLVLLLPLALMLFSVRSTLIEYDRAIDRVNGAGELKAQQVSKLEEGAWLLAAGREYNAEPYQALKEEILFRLGEMVEAEKEEEAIWFLKAAQRMMEAADLHLQDLAAGLAEGRSLQANEQACQGLTENCRLATRALNNYIDSINGQIIEGNNRIQHAFYYFIGMLSALVLIILTTNIFLFRQFRWQVDRYTKQLTDFVKELSAGRLDCRMEPIRIAELYELSIDLNKMAERLRISMEERISIQKELREAELRILQDQIKPHFIYNTLGSIVWLAEEEAYQDIIDLTMQLTCFLRISLSKGAHLIPIKDELTHIRSYLEILKVRYGEQISYHLDIASGIGDQLILKQTLQPLVENAIYHGIRQRRSGKGEIVVKVRRTGHQLSFSVRDNGVGMQPERLEEVRQSLATVCRSEEERATWSSDREPAGLAGVDRLRHRGYGLHNVASRLWLYYGSALHVTSEPGRGTCFFFSYCPERDADHPVEKNETGIVGEIG